MCEVERCTRDRTCSEQIVMLNLRKFLRKTPRHGRRVQAVQLRPRRVRARVVLLYAMDTRGRRYCCTSNSLQYDPWLFRARGWKFANERVPWLAIKPCRLTSYFLNSLLHAPPLLVQDVRGSRQIYMCAKALAVAHPGQLLVIAVDGRDQSSYATPYFSQVTKDT